MGVFASYHAYSAAVATVAAVGRWLARPTDNRASMSGVSAVRSGVR